MRTDLSPRKPEFDVFVNSLFYIPGTVGGAFIVDFFGPKWTMVSVVSLSMWLMTLAEWLVPDHRPPVSSCHWFHHEWPLQPPDQPHRGFRCGYIAMIALHLVAHSLLLLGGVRYLPQLR